MTPRQLKAFDDIITKRVEVAEKKAQERLEARAQAEVKRITVQAEGALRKIGSFVDTVLTRALERLESSGTASQSEIRALRQRLDTLEGARGAATSVAPLLALIPHPGARIASLAVAVGLGGLEGSTREEFRQRGLRAGEIEDDRGLQLDIDIREAEEALERLSAARRRARRGVQ